MKWFNRIGLIGVTFSLFLGCSPSHTRIESNGDNTRSSKPVAANFESINELIFSQTCIQCHSGPSAPHKIDLSSYEAIVQNNVFPPLIVPGDPASSSLYESIRTGRMPKRGPALTPQAIAAVRDWIAAGASKDGSGPPPDDGEEPPEDGEPPDDEEPPDDGDPPRDPAEPPDDF